MGEKVCGGIGGAKEGEKKKRWKEGERKGKKEKGKGKGGRGRRERGNEYVCKGHGSLIESELEAGAHAQACAERKHDAVGIRLRFGRF